MEGIRGYKVEISPEKSLDWAAYEKVLVAEWNELLNRNPPPSEAQIQSFFQQHPSMVPGAFNIIGAESGHYPWLSALISQPVLPAYERRIPDFMWISMNSGEIEPVLIEIEAPSKKWWTKAGKQSEELTQALNQIAQWKAWFAIPENVIAFKEFYGLGQIAWDRRHFKPAFALIYGRRAEAAINAALRAHIAQPDVVCMTYDRLNPNPKASELVCVKAVARGRFETLSVPATLTWNPRRARDRALFSGLDDAIRANPLITPARKEFLIRRRPYWDKYAQEGQAGLINMADNE